MSNSAARAAVVHTQPGDERQSELKLFTLWNQGVPPPFATLDQRGELDSKKLVRGSLNPERWWIITITALEVVRIHDQPLAPLPRNLITRAPSAVASTRHRARIEWGRAGQGHSVDVDIGAGVRFGIEGAEVDVKVIGPRSRMRETTKGDERLLGERDVGGLYVDSLISAHVVPSPGPPSARRPTLTQIITVAAGTSEQSVPIPAFARHLTVIQQGPRISSTRYRFRIGVTGPPLLSQFITNNSRRRLLIPQTATHVTTGPPRPHRRELLLQWELDL